MAEVLIYTRDWCPYCFRAKAVLDAREVSYVEVDLERNPEREAEMIEKAGGAESVPQIFINGKHIGGSDELGLLATSGELDELLGIS